MEVYGLLRSTDWSDEGDRAVAADCCEESCLDRLAAAIRQNKLVRFGQKWIVFHQIRYMPATTHREFRLTERSTIYYQPSGPRDTGEISVTVAWPTLNELGPIVGRTDTIAADGKLPFLLVEAGQEGEHPQLLVGIASHQAILTRVGPARSDPSETEAIFQLIGAPTWTSDSAYPGMQTA